MEPAWELEIREALRASPPRVPRSFLSELSLTKLGVRLDQTKALGGGFSGAFVFMTKLNPTSVRADTMFQKLVGLPPQINPKSVYMIKVYLNAVTPTQHIHDGPFRAFARALVLLKLAPVALLAVSHTSHALRY